MKKLSLLLPFLLMFFIACNTENQLETPEQQELAQLNNLRQETEEDFLVKTGIRDLLLSPEKITWEKLDAFYREAKENPTYQKNPNFKALKMCATQHVVLHFGLLEDESQKAKEARLYYLEEMKDLDTFNTKAVYMLLSKLKNELDPNYVKGYAQNVLYKNEKLIADYSLEVESGQKYANSKDDFSIQKMTLEYANKLRTL